MNLKKIILLLFICGVFGDEVKKESVMEGDSVTLNSDLTDIQKYWQILWRFGSESIDEIYHGISSYKNGSDGSFRGRLQLDSKTASLTITNMRMKHSGLYELEAANSNIGTTYKRFIVSVYESPSAIPVEAEMKSESVTPGESLTLQTDAPDPQGDELIVWRSGDEGKLIAKADLETDINSLYDTDERFRDRLILNDQDGSLTIMNTRNTDSGLYLVKISSSSKQTLHKRFIVTVIDIGWSPRAIAGIAVVLLAVFSAASVASGFFYYRWKKSEVVKVIVKEGNPITLYTCVTELHKGHKIQWWYGNNLIAEISGGKEQIYDERFGGKLDKKTGDLNISDVTIIHSGLYKLKITRNKWTTHKRFIFTVCPMTGEVMKVTETEGNFATLNTGVAELHTDDEIQWWYGAEENLIAEITGGKDQTHDVDDDERFSGKLTLDKKTGSLIVSDIKTIHSGLYKLRIIRNRVIRDKRFILTVNPVTVASKNPDQLPEINEHLLRNYVDSIQLHQAKISGKMYQAKISGKMSEEAEKPKKRTEIIEL